MDVTMPTGAPGVRPHAPTPDRAASGAGFEAFLEPAIRPDMGQTGPSTAEFDHRAEVPEAHRRADAERRAESRAADERRAADRRDAAREAEVRADAAAAARRAEQRRLAERGEARRIAERAELRRSSQAREAEALAQREATADQAAAAAAHAQRAEQVQAAKDTRTEAEAEPAPGADTRPNMARSATAPESPRKPVESELSGALGLMGLLQRIDGADRTEQASPLEQAMDHSTFTEGEAVDGPTADVQLTEFADQTTEGDEFTRLMRQSRPDDALTRMLGGRTARTDTVQLSGRGPALGGIDGARTLGPAAPSLLGPATASADAASTTKAAGSARLPAGVEASSILRQISDALQLRSGRSQTADINLNPAELGRVRVRVQVESGVARILVHAEHAGVGDLLASGLEELRRDLMAQGVHVEHLEVRSGLTDEGEAGQDAPERDEAEEVELTPERVDSPTLRRRAPRGRIDVQA